MKKLLSWVMILILTTPFAANAHEGHGHTDGESAEHYLTEPYHITVVLVAAAVLAIMVYRNIRQTRKQ